MIKKIKAILAAGVILLSAAGCQTNHREMIGSQAILSQAQTHLQSFSLEEPPHAETPDSTQLVFLEENGDGNLKGLLQQTAAAGSGVTVLSSQTAPQHQQELRAVWISYLDLESILKGKTQAEFEANMGKVFDNVADLGLNTVFMQVRPFGDALYPSQYFPWSYTVTGTEGKDPGYDPLAIMIREAHSRGLRLEAWINPYRIRTNRSQALSPDNPAQKALASGRSDAMAVAYGNGLYYNPANEDARSLIVKGVREIVENYEVDGIHFDDYFYPTTDAAFDAQSFSAYQVTGGQLPLAAWRRENVNLLVKEVYSTVKSINPKVLFGISPQGNMENNYNGQFIDVAKWLANPGYVDYIVPQIYFGFQNSSYPYAETVEQWNKLIQVPEIRLYVGLSPYKLGLEDSWAGAGKGEWIATTDILKRMVTEARQESQYGGFALFRYDSVFHPASSVQAQVEKEKANLKAVLY